MEKNGQVPHDDHDRREFLKTCGRFAATVPPAMTILLSTSLTSEAIAKSTGGEGGGRGSSRDGHGKGGHSKGRESHGDGEKGGRKGPKEGR